MLVQTCGRAFELPPSDISISYRSADRGGGQEPAWNPLLSDWDLDTAILGSADHDLYLQVGIHHIEVSTKFLGTQYSEKTVEEGQ